MAILNVFCNAPPSLYRALAISTQVFSGQYVNVTTFGQLGITINSFGELAGIGVSPQTPEELRQEMAIAFYNMTVDPLFQTEIEAIGNTILIGYNYGSSYLNNLINSMISIVSQVLGISPSTTQEQTRIITRSRALAAAVGIIIPLFLLLLIIITIFTICLRRRSRQRLKLFDISSMTYEKVGKRKILETMIIHWDAITDVQGIGSGS